MIKILSISAWTGEMIRYYFFKVIYKHLIRIVPKVRGPLDSLLTEPLTLYFMCEWKQVSEIFQVTI